jgi:DNA-directed RNA polymerase subunit RPC12/RpoP
MKTCSECGKNFENSENNQQGQTVLCSECANKHVICSICGKEYIRISSHKCKNVEETLPAPSINLSFYKNGGLLEIPIGGNPPIVGILSILLGVFILITGYLEVMRYFDFISILLLICGSICLISGFILTARKRRSMILMDGILTIGKTGFALSDFKLIEYNLGSFTFVHPAKTFRIVTWDIKEPLLSDLKHIFSSYPMYKRGNI